MKSSSTDHLKNFTAIVLNVQHKIFRQIRGNWVMWCQWSDYVILISRLIRFGWTCMSLHCWFLLKNKYIIFNGILNVTYQSLTPTCLWGTADEWSQRDVILLTLHKTKTAQSDSAKNEILCCHYPLWSDEDVLWKTATPFFLLFQSNFPLEYHVGKHCSHHSWYLDGVVHVLWWGWSQDSLVS